MKGIFLIFLIFLQILIISPSTFSDTKKVLLIIFPGGRSHHFILRELLEYSGSKEKIEFHCIIHNIDKDIWSNTKHKIYEYGNIEQYKLEFEKGLESAKVDPVFGYNELHKAMINSYQSFINENLIDRLKDHKFDLIICDFPNYLQYYLKSELNIPKSMYFTPTCSPTIFYRGLEINPTYVPILGSVYTEKMTFTERISNTIQFQLSKVFFKYFMWDQQKFFKTNNITVPLEVVIEKSVFLSQCTNGVHYAMPLPPNAENIGAVLPRLPNPIKDKRINDFLDKFQRNIYFSQGTIVNIIKFDEILDIFRGFPEIGFVLSFRKDIIDEHQFPDNVLALEWVPQNDLLGDDRIKAFITHGGLNSILESIFHAKPMVCIGVSIDQVNNAALVDYRKIGIKFSKISELNAHTLKEAIKEVLINKEFLGNIVKLSKIMKRQNPKEKFHRWLVDIIDVGYDNLIVHSYLEDWAFQIYNYDLIFIFILCFVILRRFYLWLRRKEPRKQKTD